jgi:DNA polymerase I
LKPLAPFIINPNPEILFSDSYIVVDLEVTNEEYGHARQEGNRIVYGYARGSDGREWDLYSLLDLREVPWGDYTLIVGHNAKFEFQWLQRAGVDIHYLLPFCTQIAEYVIGGNRTGSKLWPVSLDASCKRRNLPAKEGIAGRLIRSGVCPSSIPLWLVRKYCRRDVRITERLFRTQRRVIKETGLEKVLMLRLLFCPVVADLEMKGMFLDKAIVKEQDDALASEELSLVKEMEAMAGDINLKSWQQKSWFMYGDPDGLKMPYPKDKYGNPILMSRTAEFPDGAPSTDKNAIQYLTTLKLNKKQRRWLELQTRFQKVTKLRSSYTKKFQAAVKDHDSILYGGLNQTVTKTHRLSSSPNLQNIARVLKRCFSTRHEGWHIANADYAQLEFRTAGVLAQDRQVREDISDKADVHSFTASVIFGDRFSKLAEKSPEREEVRNQAKSHTFKPLYGGQSGTDDEVRYYKAFREKYPDITRMQQGWVDECLKHQQLRMVTGLIVYFPGTEYTHTGFVKNSTKILNLPVQQFATADIAPLGITILWHYLHRNQMESFLINEVHDSGLAEIAPGEEETFTALAQRAMVDDMITKMEIITGFKINYPMQVDVKIKSHWDYNQPKIGE